MKRMTWLAVALLLSAASLSAQAQNGYVTVNLNMRAAPDIDYPLITTIRAGSAVSVRGCIDDYAWCDVIAYGERGWVSGDYIEYEYQNRRVPLYGYGVQIGIPIISFVIGDYWGSHYNHRSFYRDRARWYDRPIRHRSSSRHRDARRDDRRDDRRDNRRDGRNDRRNDGRSNDRRSDGHSNDRRDTRRTVRDTDSINVNRTPRSGRQQGSEPARQRSSEPRRTDARQGPPAGPSSRPDANRGERQGRSNAPEQRQQRDNRGGNSQNRDKRGDGDGKARDSGKRGERDGKDSDDRKGDRGDRGN